MGEGPSPKSKKCDETASRAEGALVNAWDPSSNSLWGCGRKKGGIGILWDGGEFWSNWVMCLGRDPRISKRMVLFAGAVALLRMTWGRSGSVPASVPIPLIAFLSGVCNSVGKSGCW